MTKKESNNKDVGDKYLDKKDDNEGFVILLIMGFIFCILGLAYRGLKMLEGEVPGYHHKKAILLFAVGFFLFSILLFVVFKKRKTFIRN